MNFSATEIDSILPYCTPAELARIAVIKAANPPPIWRPLPGPQTMAYYSTADVVGFGGAAGGGKTDLAIGKTLTQHENVAMFRREGTEMSGIIDRMKEMLGNDAGYVGSGRWWGWRNPVPGVQVEFGSIPNLGDETKHQGRPKDLLVLDEAANMLEQQVRFLMGWVRTTNPKQRTQTLMCFNPPTTAEGRWIVEFFGPWLNKKHPNPAMPGELRYFAMIAGKEMEVPCGQRFHYQGELIIPQSRTFIPARIADNPYLMGTNYMATLQAMPEPLRSQMLYGDFDAGMEDDPWQVIPTAWVDAAMARWTAKLPKPRMDSMGVDVARGGKDNTIISRRHGPWFDELLAYPGKETPDGPTVAGLVVANTRDRAPIHIDVIGVGASPYDFLIKARQPVYGINVAEKANGSDRSGRLTFFNLRSQLWWRMREALDPANNTGVALPPDRRLMLDLCAPKWELRGRAIYVQSREEIIDAIGRSPDYASAVLLALIDTPRLLEVAGGQGAFDAPQREYDPLANIK